MQRLIDEDSAAPVPNGASQLKKKLRKLFYVVCICIILGLLVFIAVRVGKRHNKEPEVLKCYECKNCTNDVDKCADWKAPFESDCMSSPRSVENCKHVLVLVVTSLATVNKIVCDDSSSEEEFFYKQMQEAQQKALQDLHHSFWTDLEENVLEPIETFGEIVIEKSESTEEAAVDKVKEFFFSIHGMILIAVAALLVMLLIACMSIMCICVKHMRQASKALQDEKV
ncbi:unnamed protein product [Orchesella dallaii]|uniref:Uncharacterized protein n=1 Tax=Orchesella dallaii TaxID=48710 RepID=A0ABP1PQ20_9HEXA